MAKDSCLCVSVSCCRPVCMSPPHSTPNITEYPRRESTVRERVYFLALFFFFRSLTAFVSLFNGSLKIICELLCHIYFACAKSVFYD